MDNEETGHPRVYKKTMYQRQYERETDIQQIINNARSLCESIFSDQFYSPNAENLAIALRLSVERYDKNEALRSS